MYSFMSMNGVRKYTLTWYTHRASDDFECTHWRRLVALRQWELARRGQKAMDNAEGCIIIECATSCEFLIHTPTRMASNHFEISYGNSYLIVVNKINEMRSSDWIEPAYHCAVWMNAWPWPCHGAMWCVRMWKLKKIYRIIRLACGWQWLLRLLWPNNCVCAQNARNREWACIKHRISLMVLQRHADIEWWGDGVYICVDECVWQANRANGCDAISNHDERKITFNNSFRTRAPNNAICWHVTKAFSHCHTRRIVCIYAIVGTNTMWRPDAPCAL